MHHDFETKLQDRGLKRFQKLINGGLLRDLQSDYLKWKKSLNEQERADHSELANAASVEFTAIQWVEFLRQSIERSIQRVHSLTERFREFQRLYPLAPNETEQQRTILDFARDLGASARQLKGDAKAFGRFFDYDAVVERYNRRRNEAEQLTEFALNRWGCAIAAVFSKAVIPGVSRLWFRLEVESICCSVIEFRFDERVQQAAWNCLRDATSEIPPELCRELIRNETLLRATRTAQDDRLPVWTQCAALEFLQNPADETFVAVLQARFQNARQGDDFFVRRRAVRLAAKHFYRLPELSSLIQPALADTSPYVRQATGRLLSVAETRAAIDGFRQLILRDKIHNVRAAALVEFATTVDRPALHFPFLKLVVESIRTDDNAFVLQTALHTATTWLDAFVRMNEALVTEQPLARQHVDNVFDYVSSTLSPAIRTVQESAEAAPARRLAAQAAERLWLIMHPTARELAVAIRASAYDVDSGKSRSISKAIFRGLDHDLIGRTLAVLAQDDFAYDVEFGWFRDRITRGYRIRFRLWRFIYEMRRPSPDKRQAFFHTIGRVSYSWLRAPSHILGELSETRVPGEPLFHIDEGGWKSYLPLVDDVISSLNQIWRVRPVKFYTTEGITVLTPPKTLIGRLRAYIRLTLKFPDYARVRNWHGNSQHAPETYVKDLASLGIEIRFAPYSESGVPVAEDSSVRRFFEPPELAAAAALLPIAVMPWWETIANLGRRFVRYFSSVYENSLSQLFVFVVLFLVFFFLKHLYSNMTLRRARNAIPLSIGGWGTRGKSGTERLKAALLNAMGHSIVSKSSGCEAMFLFAPTYGSLREYILYRPYDKATIWEHRNVILLASWLRAQVFIWECMGLTPAYVDVLQKQWTRDDLATITNTFPDHEDLQGPAGINVAETISVFVPPDSVLMTTEQVMRPILTQASRHVRTQLMGVGWLESGLIPDEILERFPYNEHPDNIALVQLMAVELGCDEDYALKEMADRMVPDLGVLQTSPPALLRTRTLEFTNGMSANERLGCMGNWRRLSFDTQSHVDEPGTWITTVVNNRADRIARSRVFARIVVSDMNADRHVIIGNNLKGMEGYIAEAWEEFVSEITLWSGDASQRTDVAIAQLDTMAERFRQYTTKDQVRSVLAAQLVVLNTELETPPDESAINELLDLSFQHDVLQQQLAALGLDEKLADRICAYMQFVVQGFEEYSSLREKIAQATEQNLAALDDEFRATLREWYFRKLVIVEDYYASGEQVINIICEETPPGFRNRVIGLQNIKGTGLDFVYRWQSWQKCHEFCSQLRDEDAAVADKGLKQLLEFQDYGLLSEQYVTETLQIGRKAAFARRESTRTELDQVEANLTKAMTRVRTALAASAETQKSGLLDKVADKLEEVLDLTDAVRRRKQTDRIYADFGAERISQERTLLLLREINKRQKGGWVKKAIKKLTARRRKAA